MKNIVIDTVSSPISSTLDSALGIQPPSATRMSIGSFVSNALREFVGAITLAISSSKVLLVEGNFTQAEFQSYNSLYFGPSASPVAQVFQASSSVSKSKVITSPLFVVTTSSLLDGVATTDPYLTGLLVPSNPTYTLLALVNAILAIAEAEGDEIILLVNQEDETVTKLTYPSHPDLIEATNRWDYTDFAVNGALLNLVDEPVVDPVSRLGWE